MAGSQPLTNEYLQSQGGKPRNWPSGTIDWDMPADGFEMAVRSWSREAGNDFDLILSNPGDPGDFQIPIQTCEQFEAIRKTLQAMSDGGV